MNKKVSIIIPLYNQEGNIVKCLKSISIQSYSNFECIVINDGSSDRSGEMVRNYILNDNRFRYFEQVNKGVSYARNVGLENATGEYIVFIDSDDLIGEKYIEKLILPFENNDVAFTICNSHVDIHKKIETMNLLVNFDNYYNFNLFNTPWGKGFKKEYISFEFNQELSLGEDLLFNLTYLKNIKDKHKLIYFDYSEEYLYLENDSSLSNTVNISKVAQLIKIINMIDNYQDYMKINSIKYTQSKSLFRYCIELYKFNDKHIEQKIIEYIQLINNKNNLYILLKILMFCKYTVISRVYMKSIILLDDMLKGIKQ